MIYKLLNKLVLTAIFAAQVLTPMGAGAQIEAVRAPSQVNLLGGQGSEAPTGVMDISGGKTRTGGTFDSSLPVRSVVGFDRPTAPQPMRQAPQEGGFFDTILDFFRSGADTAQEAVEEVLGEYRATISNTRPQALDETTVEFGAEAVIDESSIQAPPGTIVIVDPDKKTVAIFDLPIGESVVVDIKDPGRATFSSGEVTGPVKLIKPQEKQVVRRDFTEAVHDARLSSGETRIQPKVNFDKLRELLLTEKNRIFYPTGVEGLVEGMSVEVRETTLPSGLITARVIIRGPMYEYVISGIARKDNVYVDIFVSEYPADSPPAESPAPKSGAVSERADGAYSGIGYVLDGGNIDFVERLPYDIQFPLIINGFGRKEMAAIVVAALEAKFKALLGEDRNPTRPEELLPPKPQDETKPTGTTKPVTGELPPDLPPDEGNFEYLITQIKDTYRFEYPTDGFIVVIKETPKSGGEIAVSIDVFNKGSNGLGEENDTSNPFKRTAGGGGNEFNASKRKASSAYNSRGDLGDIGAQDIGFELQLTGISEFDEAILRALKAKIKKFLESQPVKTDIERQVESGQSEVKKEAFNALSDLSQSADELLPPPPGAELPKFLRTQEQQVAFVKWEQQRNVMASILRRFADAVQGCSYDFSFVNDFPHTIAFPEELRNKMVEFGKRLKELDMALTEIQLSGGSEELMEEAEREAIRRVGEAVGEFLVAADQAARELEKAANEPGWADLWNQFIKTYGTVLETTGVLPE